MSKFSQSVMQFGSLIRIARLTPAAKGRTFNNVMADALLRILKVSIVIGSIRT